jgi:hypothetical protein
MYGKSVTTDGTLISEHFKNLKDNVVRQALKLLESEPDKLPSLNKETNYFSPIDTGLLKDLLENHYPKVKPLWTRMVWVINKRNTIDNRINEIIEPEIKNKLDKIKIKYKIGMYDQESIRVNAVPIKEVRERLRKMIENNSFDSDIGRRLTVVHHTTSSTINFYDTNGQHPDIYKVNEGKHIKENAEKIKNHLRQVFVIVNSRDDILKYIQQLNDLNRRFNLRREKLHSALREIISKVELSIVFRCKYLTPELE